MFDIYLVHIGIPDSLPFGLFTLLDQTMAGSTSVHDFAFLFF